MDTKTTVDRRDRYCIVGAGPAGLCLGRALQRAGVAYDQYERHTDVGGIWDADNPGSPMYESAHFIASKGQCHFSGFPMPDSYPDYPSNRQILDYIRAFADHWNLRPAIRFGTGVRRVEKDNDAWRVETGDGQSYLYRGVVCANGETWDPIMPDYPGTFDGEMRHSVTYRSTDEFRGRRVLIIGAGNSGCDIACDAALNADAAFISMRRGYHFIPKHIFGMPADEFAARGPHLPVKVQQKLFKGLLFMMNGDLRRYGLQAPDHELFESHPIMNTQILHHLAHGDLQAKPDVEAFDGRRVRFVDGSSESVDLVLCATGYYKSIPYIDREYFDWKGTSPDLYLNLFNRRHPGLYAMSFIETNTGAYQVFDLMAHVLANHLADIEREPARAARFRERVNTDRPQLGSGIHFVQSERHHIYVDSHAYQAYLRKVIRATGWEPLETAYATALDKRLQEA